MTSRRPASRGRSLPALNEALAKMTPQQALEIRREARFGRFKDLLFTAAAWPLGLTLGGSALFGAILLFDALSEFDYDEYRREQKLMECLQEAKRERAADYCQANWGPGQKDD